MNNKRIVKNTGILYVRMILTTLISLYSSRIILNTLGIEDFGIYNVVAGVVTMFSFLNSSMSSATQRFLAFELGKNDYAQLKKTFSASVTIHVIIALTVFVLAETAGLWFLNNKLVIPIEKLNTANWLYQFAIFSFLLTVIGVPYNAIIIAHERMDAYAYISIVDAVLKLAAIFALVWYGYDKLRNYGILIFCVSVIMLVIYKIYCKCNFPESNYHFSWNKSLTLTLLSFSGWNLLGNVAWMTMGQGLNILLNVFFGPAVNAAWGIAFQVNNAIAAFANNIRMAVNPQIVKSHAGGNKQYMETLVFESAKYSFFLLLLLTLPVLLETNIILNVWLKTVPFYAVLFCQLVLINTLLQCFDASFGMIFQAIGRIKENQIFSGGAYLMVLPVSYILLELSCPPQTIFYVQMGAVVFVAFIVKIILLKRLVGIPVNAYSKRLIFPVLKVVVIAVIPPVLIKINLTEGFLRFLLVGLTSFIFTVVAVYYVGMNQIARLKVRNSVISQILRFKELI